MSDEHQSPYLQVIVGIAIIVISCTLIWIGSALQNINVNMGIMMSKLDGNVIKLSDHEARLRILEAQGKLK